MIDNDLYLYHYGVPGMKWGKRKAIPISGQNGTTTQKQVVGKPAPKKQTVTKPAPKKQAVQKPEPEKQQVQENTEPTQKNSALKKGLIIAGVALAAIGTAILISKYTKSLANNGKGVADKVLTKNLKTKNETKSIKKTLAKELDIKTPKPKTNTGGDFIIKDRKKLTQTVWGKQSSIFSKPVTQSVFDSGRRATQKSLGKSITFGKQSRASKAFWAGMNNMPKNLKLKDLVK